MRLQILEDIFLNEDIEAVKKYYPNIPDNIFMQLVELDPTYRGNDSLGKYSKWLLNLFNKGKLSEEQFNEVTPLLNQFTIYRNRIQNKDLNSYKSLDDLAEVLALVVDDDSMLTPRQKVRFLKNVKSGKISLDKSDDYDIVLDTPKFIVYVPNTHEASMKLGKGTEWCTAHENPEWYNDYTEGDSKLYIIKNKETGERWQYSDKNGDFLNEYDETFKIAELMKQDKKLSRFFEQFLGVDYYNFDGLWFYDGEEIPEDFRPAVEKIIISNNITGIGGSAFYNCTSLTSVVIPDSVTSIGQEAFCRCKSLTNIIIPNSVKNINDYAFSGCHSLKNVTIPSSVESISKYAFFYCKNLTSVTIPNGVTSIGDCAFKECKNLTSITIPDSITSIGYEAFSECENLTSIIIPKSVTSIDDCVFYDCTSLTSVTISDSITSIGGCAFQNCTSLTDVTIPSSVTSIGNNAFSNTKWLENQQKKSPFVVVNGILIDGRKCKGKVTIPSNVKSIGKYAFSGCNSVTSVTIPSSVTNIGNEAFRNCENLESVTIQNSVTNIGNFAFYRCNELTIYTNNDYVISYCKENEIAVKPLSTKNESLSHIKLKIKEF